LIQKINLHLFNYCKCHVVEKFWLKKGVFYKWNLLERLKGKKKKERKKENNESSRKMNE